MTGADGLNRSPISVVVLGNRIRLDVLAEALESVIAQSHLPHEVLVVSDGSSAGLADLIVRYSGVRAVISHDKRSGVARNSGLAASTGDYVVFLDGRHKLMSGALQSGISSLQRHPGYAFTYGRFSGPHESRHLSRETARRVVSDHYVELLKGDYIGTLSVVMYRRSALDYVGGFDPSLKAAEGFALNLQLTSRFLVYGHGMAVAEYVGGNADADHLGPAERAPGGRVVDARASISVLRAQGEHVRGNRLHEAALSKGLQDSAIRHGLALTHELRDDIRCSKAPAIMRSLLSLTGFGGYLLLRRPRELAGCLRKELVPWAGRRWSIGVLSPASWTGRAAAGYDNSQELRRIVHTTVPADAAVLIYGPPDGDLPALEGRQALHFEASSALGHEVGEQSAPALTAVTERRVQGAEFMLIPGNASWWFEHHDRTLKAHLDELHTRIWSDDHCVIYRLSQDGQGIRTAEPPRVLVAGHFSFQRHGATAGDVLARDIVCDWLGEAGRPFDVALAPPFLGGVDWRSIRPERYSHVVFVCGPFTQIPAMRDLFDRFSGQRTLGVNLSMGTSPDFWNPFDVLIERDSALATRPDLTFLSGPAHVPVVGICLREHSGGTRTAEAAIRRLVQSREMATLQIDTRLDGSQHAAEFAPRSPREVEALLARVDLVITTRLHGMVLALKNGVPVIAIDPGNDGRKIISQAGVVGWPIAFDVHDLTDEAMQQGVDYCLTDEARSMAARCAARARTSVAEVREQFIRAL